MKKNIKLIIGFILGIIFCGTTVYAVNTIINASEVGYIDNTNIEAANVQDAIDKLYKKAKEYENDHIIATNTPNLVVAYTYNQDSSSNNYCVIGEESTCKVTYCYTNHASGSCPDGTIIKYRVNNKETKYFHVLHDDGDTITMQQRENTIKSVWNIEKDVTKGPVDALNALAEATKNWVNIEDFEYEAGTTILYETPYNFINQHDSNPYQNAYTMEKRILKARMITEKEAYRQGCRFLNAENFSPCPLYMINYTSNVSQYGGIDDENTAGYTTESVWWPGNPWPIWGIQGSSQSLVHWGASANQGVRAVVKIYK